VNAIDNPATLGVAIATAQLVNSRTADPLTCEKSIFNMNRSMRVKVNLYAVLNADKTIASKKQTYSKTVKQFTSEKLAVDTPNCLDRQNRLNKFGKNAGGEAVCITDPVFHFACSSAGECGNP
jgi:hypothetical protein